MLHPRLNVNRFLKAADTANFQTRKKQTERCDDTESDDDMDEEEKESWQAYRFNKTAAWFHLAQGVIVLIIITAKTSKINPDFVFISPQRELIWQSYALLKADTTSTECSDLQKNKMYQDKTKWVLNEDMVDHAIFNFNNTVLIPYLKHGMTIHTDVMLAIFFFLSFGFQMLNGYILNTSTGFPRVINYIEYSISSSLMIIVMAINVGIVEIFTITSLAGLFFTMNIFGACTELMLELYITLNRLSQTSNYLSIYWITIPQMAAWIAFLFAVCPVTIQYNLIQQCSNTGVPAHVHAAIGLQVILFCFFGIAQTISVVYRTVNIDDDAQIQYTVNTMDNINVILSFSAKTALAWSLLAPALTVKDNYLT